jgi:hypothetical protein
MLDTTSSATKFFIVVYMFQYSNREEVYIHVFLKLYLCLFRLKTRIDADTESLPSYLILPPCYNLSCMSANYKGLRESNFISTRSLIHVLYIYYKLETPVCVLFSKQMNTI